MSAKADKVGKAFLRAWSGAIVHLEETSDEVLVLVRFHHLGKKSNLYCERVSPAGEPIKVALEAIVRDELGEKWDDTHRLQLTLPGVCDRHVHVYATGLVRNGQGQALVGHGPVWVTKNGG